MNLGFIPINMPAIGFLKFLQVSAAFNFENNRFFNVACFYIFQTWNDFIYPNVNTALV